jgi:transposase
MPRFKDHNYDQTKMIPISFDRQILPGTLEYSLIYLVEHELDLSLFDHRYRNDEAGRPAYDPAILLKIVLLAYSRGITSSRKIEQLCRENILFMAISADSQPHYTTIADFISSSADEIAQLFLQVLMVCDAEGLIRRTWMKTCANANKSSARSCNAPAARSNNSWMNMKCVRGLAVVSCKATSLTTTPPR